MRTKLRAPWELPNMPKSQPCPKCNRMAKRTKKSTDGAFYSCGNCHLDFFVRHPKFKEEKVGQSKT